MNQKEIKELIEFLIEKDIAEFEYERGDVKLRVVRPGAAGQQGAMMQMPMAMPVPMQIPTVQAGAQAQGQPQQGQTPSAAAQSSGTSEAPKAAGSEEAGLQIVKSPIVGTFYESPSPGAAPFVKEGDRVSVGQVLCIVEAMKLMNEIESDFAGTIVKRLVSNGQPVEYGQPLFSVRP